MKKTIWVLIGFLALSASTFADTVVQFAVDPADVGPSLAGPRDIDLFSSGLDGIVLAGQTLSLDLVLSNQDLARLFLISPDGSGVLLNIHTNAPSYPGFVGTTVGYLLDANGNPIGDPQVAGRSDGNDGTTAFGLVGFTTENLGGTNVVDLSGVHFFTTLPDTGFVITDAQLRFSVNDASDRIEFGTALQLPEPSTLPMLAIGVIALLIVTNRFSAARPD